MSFELARLLAGKIHRAATRARGSELKFQGEVDGYLREYLKAFGIDYDPEVNKHLQISDYSSAGRPDSLFGRIVLDYKAPGILKTAAGLRKAKTQVVDDYLNPACGGTACLILRTLRNGRAFYSMAAALLLSLSTASTNGVGRRYARSASTLSRHLGIF
jgi:hypothetical protein